MYVSFAKCLNLFGRRVNKKFLSLKINKFGFESMLAVLLYKSLPMKLHVKVFTKGW